MFLLWNKFGSSHGLYIIKDEYIFYLEVVWGYNWKYFFLKFIFNWRIIASQWCVGFCCTTRWISYMSTYIPSLMRLPPIHPIPPASQSSQHPAGLPVLYSNLSLAIYLTHGSVYMLLLVSPFGSPPPSFTVCLSLFSMSVSLFLPCK